MEASHPAWPAPTTTTSYCSVNGILVALLYLTEERGVEPVAGKGHKAQTTLALYSALKQERKSLPRISRVGANFLSVFL
jgi:hypothetical protein